MTSSRLRLLEVTKVLNASTADAIAAASADAATHGLLSVALAELKEALLAKVRRAR